MVLLGMAGCRWRGVIVLRSWWRMGDFGAEDAEGEVVDTKADDYNNYDEGLV
jgi:hypothetical protein